MWVFLFFFMPASENVPWSDRDGSIVCLMILNKLWQMWQRCLGTFYFHYYYFFFFFWSISRHEPQIKGQDTCNQHHDYKHEFLDGSVKRLNSMWQDTVRCVSVYVQNMYLFIFMTYTHVQSLLSSQGSSDLSPLRTAASPGSFWMQRLPSMWLR